MLATERAVLIRYIRNGQRRRGSGLRVGDQFVLTADHCATGIDHRVVTGGQEYEATPYVRSASAAVDVAMIRATALSAVEPLRCARVDRAVSTRLADCQALGFPMWKGSPEQPRLAQVSGYVPTAEGLDPYAAMGSVPLMTLKITDPEARGRPVPIGELDRTGGLWAGMSGAVVVTADDVVIGVVRSHNLAEGGRSLTLTPVEAIASLPNKEAGRFWTALQVSDPWALPMLPLAVDSDVSSPDQRPTSPARERLPFDIGRDDASPDRFHRSSEG